MTSLLAVSNRRIRYNATSMARISGIWRYTRQDWGVFFEAAGMLVLARAMIMLPFRWISPHLGKPQKLPAALPLCKADPAIIQVVTFALRRAVKRLPWKSTCLVQAIAGKLILRRRGVPSILFLGASFDQDHTFAAHAWLQCGDFIVSGQAEKDHFTPLMAFTDE